jgi:DNA-binding beta-propeller fold protein YncE
MAAFSSTASFPSYSSYSSFDCRICYEKFSEKGERMPRTLPSCGHTFCHSCLVNLLQSSSSSSAGKKCPLCQREIQGRTAEELHPCYVLIDVIAAQETMAPIQAPPPETTTSRSTLPEVEAEGKCPLHPTYPRDFICTEASCPQKGVLICSLCERSAHAGHKTRLVAELGDGKRDELKSMLSRLEASMSTVNCALITVQETSRSLRAPSNQKEGETGAHTAERVALDLLHHRFEEYRTLLNNREQELAEQIQALTTSKVELLEQQSRELTTFLSKSYQLSERSNALLAQPQTAAALFSQLPSIQSELKQLEETQLHLSGPRVDASLTLALPETQALFGRHLGTLTPAFPLVVAPQLRHSAFQSARRPFEGTFLSKLGGYGSADGQLQGTHGVAIDSTTDTLFVSDYQANRVQVFRASDGTFLRKFGCHGSGEGQFSNPWDLAVDSSTDSLFVVDCANNRVQVFRASDGTFLRTFGSSGSADGKLAYPRFLAVDTATDSLFVTDQLNGQVQVFRASDSAFLRRFGSPGLGDGQFAQPSGVAIDSSSDTLFVGDQHNNRVQVFRASDGKFIRKIGSFGTADGQFNGPFGVMFDRATDSLFVSDSGNHRIQVFRASDGTFLRKFGSHGSSEGQFNSPSAIKIDSVGDVFVADFNNNRVQIFS